MIIIYSASIVLAAEESSTKVDLTEIQIKTLYLQEEAKTRAEMKQYFANQRILMEKDLQKSVDENFQILDKRQDVFLREASFKLGIIFFSALISGSLIVMLIRRKIDKKEYIKTTMTDNTHKEKLFLNVERREEDILEAPRKPSTKKPVIEEAVVYQKPITNFGTLPSIKEANDNGY